MSKRTLYYERLEVIRDITGARGYLTEANMTALLGCNLYRLDTFKRAVPNRRYCQPACPAFIWDGKEHHWLPEPVRKERDE